MSVELESRPPLTVEEFEALAQRQGWDEDTRIELLAGEPVCMSPVDDPHIGCINRLTRLFIRRYPDDVALVSIQNPVRLGVHDLPQPDVALLRPRPDDYGSARAIPADILLLVEVSDTTLRTDLGRKARLYASAGIVEYWVVDLRSQTVYVHRDPRASQYASRIALQRGESISTPLAPGTVLGLDEILP